MNKSILVSEEVAFDINMHDEELLKTLFNMQAANIARTKMPFTLVFVSIHPSSSIFMRNDSAIERLVFNKVNEFLKNQVRNSDLVFKFADERRWVLLLSCSGETESQFFVERIFSEISSVAFEPHTPLNINLSASLVEVANSKASYEEVLEEGERSLRQAIGMGAFETCKVDTFKRQEIENVKVSIVEEDATARDIIQSLLHRADIDNFELDIQTFRDGEQFLESSWYQSGHTHLVILNDYLPKKNGIEVVQELRRKPNHKKYIIFMMTSRKTDDEVIRTYEIGADKLITKPFNLSLFEAEVKSLLMRIRA